MHDVRNDEAWAEGLAARVADVAPVVPVDVPGAVRRGRRRLVARTAVGAAGVVGVLAVGGLAGQQLLGPDDAGTSPAAQEVVGFTRAVEEVDGQEQEVATMDGDQARAEMEREAAALEAEIARLDGLMDQSDDQLNLAYMTRIAEQYDLTDLPDVAIVERVPALEWGPRIAACLTDRGGWDVHTTPGTGGWQAHYDPVYGGAFGADLYACAAMYPADLGPSTAG